MKSLEITFYRIALIGLIAGTLDILLAIFWYALVKGNTTPLIILQSVASGIFGKAAYSGGLAMGFYGLVLHYFITLAFTAFYIFLFAKLSFLKSNRIIAGILYGIFIWLIMNLAVVPLTFKSVPAFSWPSFTSGLIIIIIAVGLPVSYLTAQYGKKI